MKSRSGADRGWPQIVLDRRSWPAARGHRPRAVPVAKYRSRSRPDITYVVKRDVQGSLSCTCPAWIYKRGGARTCKHVEDVARTHDGFLLLTDIPTALEAQKMADPDFEIRWIEEHLQPKDI